MFTKAQRPKSQFISAPFQKRYAIEVITGIADAGKDQGLTAIIHSPKECFFIIQYYLHKYSHFSLKDSALSIHIGRAPQF
jgi:hypothetical protein